MAKKRIVREKDGKTGKTGSLQGGSGGGEEYFVPSGEADDNGEIPVFILDCDGVEQVFFHPLPEEVSFTNSTTYNSFNVISKGTVDVPSGTEVRQISFECDFFGSALRNSPAINPEHWQEPYDVRETLNRWQREKKVLKLNMGIIGYSNDVTIADLQLTNHGAFGNVRCAITFKVDRDISIRIIDGKDKKGGKKDKTRPRKKKPEKKNAKWPKIHVVKKGDTLWKLAKKYYGDGKKWQKIASKNKDVIAGGGSDGRKTDAYIIDKPGLKLTIPEP